MSPRPLQPPEFEDEYELPNGDIVRSAGRLAIHNSSEPPLRVRRVRLADGEVGPWKTIEWEEAKS